MRWRDNVKTESKNEKEEKNLKQLYVNVFMIKKSNNKKKLFLTIFINKKYPFHEKQYKNTHNRKNKNKIIHN
jgi:hypothetical protein